MRDTPVIAALDQILRDLHPDDGTPLVMVTGQGGMVPFHVCRAHPGRLHIIDRFGLLDSVLSSSATAARAGRGRFGLNLGWQYLLQHWDAIRAESGAPAPDLFMDVFIGAGARESLRERGFVAVYEQTGDVVSDSEILPGRKQPAVHVIFLRAEFAARLPAQRLRSFEFSAK